MKSPKHYANIDEIRESIDDIDKQIIDLFGERSLCIKEIVRFKKNEEDIIAQKRYDQVFEVRRKWAEEKGIDPDVVENIYKILIHYFIDEQKKLLKLK